MNSRGPSLERARLANARQDGHRWGSLVNTLLAKNGWSPANKVNSSVQSRQVNVRSWYTLSSPPRLGRLDGGVAELTTGRTGMARVLGGVRARSARGRRPGTLSEEDTRGVKPLRPHSAPCGTVAMG